MGFFIEEFFQNTAYINVYTYRQFQEKDIPFGHGSFFSLTYMNNSLVQFGNPNTVETLAVVDNLLYTSGCMYPFE